VVTLLEVGLGGDLRIEHKSAYQGDTRIGTLHWELACIQYASGHSEHGFRDRFGTCWYGDKVVAAARLEVDWKRY
jgi:hypothetical protein